jgi:hypothetical protein
MMGRFGPIVFGSGLLLLSISPVWGFQCPTLIKEGKDLLASAKLSAAEQKKVKALLDESQKLHDSGKHDESTSKAKEALAVLGKK